MRAFMACVIPFCFVSLVKESKQCQTDDALTGESAILINFMWKYTKNASFWKNERSSVLQPLLVKVGCRGLDLKLPQPLGSPT
ncbi:hypothetical protein J6590_100609 [Homalodisca vitripennis]|nr:hypothetical protein J6590_100609 [Homalodisca vitripennis]